MSRFGKFVKGGARFARGAGRATARSVRWAAPRAKQATVRSAKWVAPRAKKAAKKGYAYGKKKAPVVKKQLQQTARTSKKVGRQMAQDFKRDWQNRPPPKRRPSQKRRAPQKRSSTPKRNSKGQFVKRR